MTNIDHPELTSFFLENISADYHFFIYTGITLVIYKKKKQICNIVNIVCNIINVNGNENMHNIERWLN